MKKYRSLNHISSIWVSSADFWTYLPVQHRVNIINLIEEKKVAPHFSRGRVKVKFAYPNIQQVVRKDLLKD